MRLTAGSLFSGGIDGMGIAFSLVGVDIRWHVEIEETNRRLLKKHDDLWRNAGYFADVRSVGRHNLQSVDIIFGGFPCQDVSLAGKRAGMGKGTRSGLWSEFCRIVGELEPRIVVIENTPGLFSPIKHKALAIRRNRSPFIHAPAARTKLYPPPAIEIARQLAEMGYVGSYGVISSADAGAPHLRERVFMVGYSVRQRRQEPRAIEQQRHDLQRDTATPRPQREPVFHAPVADGQGDSMGISNGIGRKTGEAEYHKRPLRHVGGRSGAAVRRKARRTIPHYSRSGKHCQPARKNPVFVRRQLAGRTAQKRRRGQDESRLGRNPDGFTPRLDGFRGYPARPGAPQAAHEPPRLVTQSPKLITRRIAALGNAVHWQVFYPLAWSLVDLLRADKKANKEAA